MNHHVAAENKEHTHVLIIGNGFDLEHGLKTKYENFFENRGEIGNNVNNNFYTRSKNIMYFPPGFFYGDVLNLYKYNKNMPYKDKGIFYKDIMSDFKMSENWFDFERVVYLFVKGLNKGIMNPTKLEEPDQVTSLGDFKEKINTKDINSAINGMYEDFRHCVQNLHDYLCEQYEDIVEELRDIAKTSLGRKNIRYGLLDNWLVRQEFGESSYFVKKEGPIIEEKEELEPEQEKVFPKQFERYISFLKERHTDRFNRLKKNSKFQFFLKEIVNKHKLMVLNFNYTRVFEKLYENDLRDEGIDNIKHHHIHGHINKAHSRELQRLKQKEPDIDPNKINLVLGCQSFKPEDDISSFFNVFTKAKQRESCGTIEGYKSFLHELEKCQNITFHIIGHSLDEIDHDVLQEVLGFQNSRIRVYYHSKEALCRLKKNIIKIIGKEDVKKRVEFICQYHPQEGVFCINIG